MPHIIPFGSKCPRYPTNPSSRVRVSFLCTVTILSLEGVIFCISDLLWKYVCQKGKNKICVSSPWSGIRGVVSEPYSGPWAAPDQPFLEKLSRPDTQAQRPIPNQGTDRGPGCPAHLQARPEHRPWGSGATGEGPSPVVSQPGWLCPTEWQHQLSLLAVYRPSPRSRDWVRDPTRGARPDPHLSAGGGLCCAALHKAKEVGTWLPRRPKPFPATPS